MFTQGKISVLAVASLLALSAADLHSQTTFATITGTATDSTGSAIPGVTVTATHVESNIQTSAQTNNAGVYTLPQLKEGQYTVGAKNAGFKEFISENVVLRARDTRRLDIVLEVGAVETKVEVTGGATLIETETARISDSKDATLLKNLPLNTRSLTAFLALSPNVLSAGYGLSYRRFAGSRGNQGDVGIDGISTSTAYDGSQISPLVGYIESFEEVRVDMASNSAEYGAIGQVTVISKSGTNQLHGNAFDYYTTPWFRARDPFAQQRTTGISHQPGASIGGPIHIPKIYNGRNKTFFFFSYETSTGSAAQDFLNPTVPLAAWRAGDFSAAGTTIRDPFTNTPYPNNQIPASQINPVSQRIQDRFYPLPNFGNTAVFGSANYREYKIRDYDPNSYYTTRVDHRLSDKAFLYVRWTWNQAYNRQFLGNLPTIGRNSQRRDTRAANVSFTYNLRQQLVNEFRAGVSFNNNPITPPTNGLQVARELGITGLVDGVPDLPGMPHFSFTGTGSGFAPIDQGSSYNYRRPGNREFNYSFQDLVTWFHGRHSVKAGLIVSPHFHADKSADSSLFGNAVFSQRYTGFAYADFLLGIPTTVSRAYGPIGYKRHWIQDTLFVTDDFKVTPQLTLTAGLRYEYTTNFTESNGREAMFDIGTGKIVVPNGSLGKVSPLLPSGYVGVVEAKDVGLPGDTLLHATNNFAPRIGLAYRPWGNNTVFRAGYGIFFDMVPRGVTAGGTPFLINEPAYTNPAVPTVIFPRVFPETPLGPTTISIPNAVNPNLRRPFSMQYTATIEHQHWNTGFRISYIGTNTRQGQWSYNINQPVPDTRLFVDKPRLFPNYPAISYVTNGAGHQYHALTVTAERRMKSGLHYQLSYTLARDIGDIDLAQSPENAYDRLRERSVWEDIPTHRVGGNVMYELPFGKGKKYLSGANRAVRAIAGGWSLSAIYSMTSNNFLTPLWTGPDPTGTAYTTSRTPAQVTIRPNYLRPGNLPSDQRTVNRWFDVSAFGAPQAGAFGTAAKGVIKGPGVSVVDTGLSKYFFLGEKLRLRYEVTATNFFNHPNWAVPGLNITTLAQAGVITAASGTHSLDQPGARAFRMSLRLEW
jgi:hypothetical protein